MICTVDTTTTSQDDRVTVRRNKRCVEDRSMFRSSLSYGSCTNGQNSQLTANFNSSDVASFMLDASNLFGEVCLEAQTTYRDEPGLMCTGMERLMFMSCSVDEIRSVADPSVTIDFSTTETSGEVPHGTVCTFSASSGALVLVGESQSTCRNGIWDSLSRRSTESKMNCCFLAHNM